MPPDRKRRATSKSSAETASAKRRRPLPPGVRTEKRIGRGRGRDLAMSQHFASIIAPGAIETTRLKHLADVAVD
jgi:hypothetical protein